MRLGGPVFDKFDSSDAWAAAVKRQGYRAAYCPVKPGVDDGKVRAYADAAAKAGIVIAEVGAWSNPLSPDDAQRRKALQHCKDSLALADRIGARCCVNIAGSRGEKWDGPSPLDLTAETFDMIVQTVREIIDAVRPTRTFYTLETMPWMYPDSPDSYVRLLDSIDRPAAAVHFDPVNLINCPERYFDAGAVIREFVARLGPRIRSCHAKDIILADRMTVHLDECRPGKGGLDYRVCLRELSRLDADLPLMLEHLSAEEYPPAAAHIRAVAAELGIPV
ncbi:MAG: sugar phosphate isomerase/epimerase family protein [Phycisphaerae bacterium]